MAKIKAETTGTAYLGGEVALSHASFSYLDELLDEKVSADFVGLSPRTMQSFRQKGGGPPYVKISSRCVRYRRRDLIGWIESMVRSNTADPGPA